MRIATAAIQTQNSYEAIAAVCAQLNEKLGGRPDLVVAHHTSCDRIAEVESALASCLVGSSLIGATSCRGIMTDAGLYGFGTFGLGLWGLRDPGGAYGAGFAELGDDPGAAAVEALEAALEQADRSGETPALVWIHATPGDEEAVLASLDAALGGHVPIAGGSPASDAIGGQWSCFANRHRGARAVAVAVMFPSSEIAISYAFQSGYSPSGPSGVATCAEGRVIAKIDGESAAEVYNRWSGGRIDGALAAGGNILALTSLSPLACEVGRIGGGKEAIPYYKLLHPDSVTPDGQLTLFANVVEGERLHFMTGSTESLIARGGRVVASAFKSGEFDVSRLAGALVIFCAGCMLTIGEQMPEVVEVFDRAFDSRPFLGGFTFGEQGCFLGGENRHGNLMVSVVLFAN
jgi:hypothetical protein